MLSLWHTIADHNGPVTRVLFVCLGNICRSPVAEAIFADKVTALGLDNEFTCDSAGTGAWHSGETPDPRSIAILAAHGHKWKSRARQVRAADFEEFDIVVAMDRSNLADLRAIAPNDRAELRLLLTEPKQDVPDPYYGGPDGFENGYQLIAGGIERLLDELRSRPEPD